MSNESSYAETAYGASEVPRQERSTERPWNMRFAKARLPWGNPEELTPVSFLEDYSPRDLRSQEQLKSEREEQIATSTYAPSAYELIDFHIRDDHERFRYALLPASSHFWLHMRLFGKWFFFYFSYLAFPATSL